MEFSKYNVSLIRTTRQKLPNSNICDLTNKHEVDDLFRKVNPDLVIHCAAFVPKKDSEYESPTLSIQNKLMLHNILKATKAPIIYVSSMTVYGASKRIIRNERDAGSPDTLYGLSKFECETLLKKDGRDSLSIRIPGLFGKTRDNGIVVNTIKSLINGYHPNLPSNKIIWSSIDVEDAAQIIARLSVNAKFNGYTPINVGYPGVQSINRFLNICEAMFGRDIDYKVIHPEFGFDLTLLRKLNIKSSGSFESALKKIKDKYESNK